MIIFAVTFPVTFSCINGTWLSLCWINNNGINMQSY